MQKVTLEEAVNDASKDLLLNVIKFLKMDEESKSLIPGFRNNKLHLATENQLKVVIIERFKRLKLDMFNEDFRKGEELFTLEKYEEIYDDKIYKCFTFILADLATENNVEVASEAYNNLFAYNLDYNSDLDMEYSPLDRYEQEIKKLNKTIEKLKSTNEKLNQSLSKKGESVELHKKLKKENEAKIETLENKVLEQEKTIRTKNKTIETMESTILNLKHNLKEVRAELEELQDKVMEFTIVYGYNESFYDCSATKYVLLPSSIDELLNLGQQYKIKAIYFRENSLSRLQIANIKKHYPQISVEYKPLAALFEIGLME